MFYFVVCARIKIVELENTLKYLNNKNRKFCSMEEFKEKRLIKQCHESDSMFKTLSSAFMDDPDVVHKKIEKALVLYLKCVLISELDTTILRKFICKYVLIAAKIA